MIAAIASGKGGTGKTMVSASLIAVWDDPVIATDLDVEEPKCAEPILGAGYGWGTVILVFCIQPAVIEELAFRGVILGSLRRVLGRRDAVIVSALMFMVLHLSVLSFPHLLLIGLVLGYLRIRSGSLYPCMVLHFTHNFMAIMAEAAGW